MNRNWKQLTANMLVLVTLTGQSAFAGGRSFGGNHSQSQSGGQMNSRPSFSYQQMSKGLPGNSNNAGNTLVNTQTFMPVHQIQPITNLGQNSNGRGTIKLPGNTNLVGNLQQSKGTKPILPINVGPSNGSSSNGGKGSLNFGNLISNRSLNSNSIKHVMPISLNGSQSKPSVPNGMGKKIDPMFSQGQKKTLPYVYGGLGGFGLGFCGNGCYGNGFCGNGWFGNGCCNPLWFDCGWCGYGCGNYCGGWWNCNNYCCGYYPIYQPYPLTVCSPIYVTQPASAVSTAPSTTTVVINNDVDKDVPPSPTQTSAREIDLGVKEVKVLSKGDAQNGPLYRVSIMNKGPMKLDKPARVAVISINDGKPSTETPRMIETVKSLNVGETVELDMRLPVAANTFPMLLVAVETPESFKDANEQDNVAQGEVAQLPLAMAAVK